MDCESLKQKISDLEKRVDKIECAHLLQVVALRGSYTDIDIERHDELARKYAQVFTVDVGTLETACSVALDIVEQILNKY